jgi:hypothetical protein
VGEIDDDLLRQDHDVDGVAKRRGVETAVLAQEADQVE